MRRRATFLVCVCLLAPSLACGGSNGSGAGGAGGGGGAHDGGQPDRSSDSGGGAGGSAGAGGGSGSGGADAGGGGGPDGALADGAGADAAPCQVAVDGGTMPCTEALAAANEYDYFCGLKGGGLQCWGSMTAAYFVTQLAPVVAAAPADLAQIAVIDSLPDPQTFCGVDRSGRGTCWGATVSSTSLGTNLRAATLSRYGSCALHDDGSVTCSASITPPPSGHSFTQIAASEDLVAAIDTAGVPSLENNATFPAGVYTEIAASGARRVAAIRSDGAAVSIFGTSTVVKTGSFAHVAVDDSGRACALDGAGAITCWSLSGATAAPFGDLPSGPFVRIVGAYSTFCALRATGTTTCWGDVAVSVPAGW
jgi:hypothetical protein